MDKKNDLFSEIIKDKLTNYTLPVDDDSWDKIAKRLNQAPRKRVQQRWAAGIAVAASIALLFMIFSINKKMYHHETANQLSDHEKTIIQNVSEKEILKPVFHQGVENPTDFRKSESGERLAENNLTDEVISEKEIVEEIATVPEEEESGTQEIQSFPIDSNLNFEKEMQLPPIKHKKQHSIRFSLGSGGSLLAENNTKSGEGSLNSDLVYFRSATVAENNSRTEDILSNENYPEVTHHLPLSFGVTIKKDLNRTFAIESGIVYSFIETTFNRDSYAKSNADLQLHYVGIPLNIHTRIFGDRFSRWEAYLSAGGMVEKGILSHFIQKTYYNNNDNSVMTVTSNEEITGLQWSVSVFPGVDYQIYKNYSIYLEPKLSYYFDNNQPVSARTEHPVVVGINAGIRYSW